jgi:lipopolysaccharide transport system ATP-binding protein
MSDIAIEVDSVWKKFHRGEFHDSLRDFLPALARRALGRGPKRDELAAGDFWALKDVSFQVRQGEVLGIIGANGAGKSTLLKILAKILKPNRGQIRVNGRLRALIEVAAGFHPDLTGRENVYLNGTILGMKKREIDAKFDEIVEFSGIGEFLDTPVKRYSSGMYARLGFAVAAHLDPEILVVDEVLAVGDAAFQQKCLGKMGEVARSGRTVLFVSHGMAAVERLCQKAALIEKGCVSYYGPVSEGIQRYLPSNRRPLHEWKQCEFFGDRPHFRHAHLVNSDGSHCTTPTTSSQFGVAIELCVPRPCHGLILGLCVSDQYEHYIFSTSPLDCDLSVPAESGVYRTTVLFPRAIFMSKEYGIKLVLYHPGQVYDTVSSALRFTVLETASLGNAVPGGRVGDVQIECVWTPITRCLDSSEEGIRTS